MNTDHKKSSIAAVIAAAGFSRRMGDFKQLLPWQQSTVIESVVANLHASGASPVLCVVGHCAGAVAAALRGSPAHIVHNPNYHVAEMLSSYQVGVTELLSREATGTRQTGTLLALGDQPHIPVDVLRQVICQVQQTPEQIVIPSHQMRRGHPIYLPRRFWPDLLALTVEQSLRDLLTCYAEAITYVDVETDAIRRDMDTPADYAARKEEMRQRVHVNCTRSGGHSG
jgi:molybdenum cofactor cytidylyltransferase